MSADIRLAPTECCGDGPDGYCVDCPEKPNPLLAALEARYDALQDRITRYRRKGKPTKELLAIHRADELAEAIAIVRGVK